LPSPSRPRAQSIITYISHISHTSSPNMVRRGGVYKSRSS